MIAPPPAPCPTFTVGVTGHRQSHPSWPRDSAPVRTVVGEVFDRIEAARAGVEVGAGCTIGHRIVTLLADGADQMAAEAGIARGWSILVPLPFGRDLSLALVSPAGGDGAFASFCEKAQLFELADADAEIATLRTAMADRPGDAALSADYAELTSQRYALAGTVMIEQSDILVAIWDGQHLARVGGTGHMIAAALDRGCAVVRIDPAAPADWHILQVPEELRAPPGTTGREDLLETLVSNAICRAGGTDLKRGSDDLSAERWPRRSSRFSSSYRRIEALFGGTKGRFRSLVQTYETPEAIARGSARELIAQVRDLPGMTEDFVSRIERGILHRFAWADGISSNLSDKYRGGMVMSFVLSATAIVAGILYQPLHSDDQKWMFSLAEFLTLITILAITAVGLRKRWHSRWFETRRVGEYLRQAPILLALGVARPAGRWPKGINTSWPEAYALAALREVGMPPVRITGAYLRQALQTLVDPHITSQRDYHFAKAARLTRVHHLLDRVAERLFLAAVLSVASYLGLKILAMGGTIPEHIPDEWSKIFTFLGVVLPALGAALSGLRFFGDFERFAAISEVTAEKLDALHDRVAVLLTIPEDTLGYAEVAALIHEMDQTVVSEIENWQAVFGGKQISVPA